MPPFTNAPEGASRGARPFASAEDAWHWTMAALVARRDGAGPVLNVGRVARPCEPDDVVKCLDRLYRQRRIDLSHARILRIWGERQAEPDPVKDRGDYRIWREAIDRLGWPLRQLGIVGTPTRTEAVDLIWTGDLAVNRARVSQDPPALCVTAASTDIRG
jgi:hypothetical protein